MKITDISSTSNPSEEELRKDKEEEDTRKRTLLQRYGIPIEHLDFAYVKKCTDSREIEQILRILRSGEEGTYPDLEKFVEDQLQKVHPRSRLLRVEKPVIRTQQMDKSEQEEIQSGLQEWLNRVATMPSSLYHEQFNSAEIFTDDEKSEVTEILKDFPLPVRGSAEHKADELGSKPFSSQGNTNTGQRIKSWEYDKWDKYDVDAELTKLDIKEMQREEWEKMEKPKIIEEQQKIERLMKPVDSTLKSDSKQRPHSTNQTPSTNAENRNKGSIRIPVENPSFIEEVNDQEDDDEAGVTVNTSAFFKANGSSLRKTRVVIEDLNLRM